MKIGGNFSGFDISSRGLSIQRKKMNLIAENIANADTVRTEGGQPYQRKTLEVTQKQDPFMPNLSTGSQVIKLNATNENHISNPVQFTEISRKDPGLSFNELKDSKEGDIVYMPDHPDADEEGYVQMSNVNIITEMVDMIAATRSYEANLTALNASKQIVKDSLEI
jgi:flagellar basal-body rod protein FlgC